MKLNSMEIYEQFANDVKEVNKLGQSAKLEHIYQVVCDRYAASIIKQGGNLEIAKRVIQERLDSQDQDLYNQIWVLKTLVEWNRNGKQIYRFDKSLMEVLQSEKDLEIPMQCLNQLPTKSFYIEMSENEGFFFALFSEIMEGEQVNLINLLPTQGTEIKRVFSVQFKDGQKVSEALYDTLADNQNGEEKNITDELIAIMSKLLYLVLYLAAINAEITDIADKTVTKQHTAKVAVRAKKSVKNGNRIYPTLYYVGRDFGKRYVNQLQSQTGKEGNSNGTKKRPHIRRSHFHHYWMGSKEERKLILKWVDTVFVNGGENEDDLPTVHKVK